MDATREIPREATASVTRLLDVAREAGDYRRARLLAQRLKPSQAGRHRVVGVDRFSFILGLMSALGYVAVVVWTYTFHHV